MVYRFFVLLCCFSCYFEAILPQEPQFSEELQFEERTFNFGEIKEEDGIVSHIFKFRNRGKKALHISSISVGCGCVQYEFPKEPIAPGAMGEVKVSYNPAYRPGFFSKEIVVLSNNNSFYSRIWIKGTVIPGRHPVEENYPYNYGNGLWMNFKVMAFGRMEKGSKKVMKLKFANDTDKDMQLFFVVVGGNTDIKFTSPHLLKAHEEGVMPIAYEYTGNYSAVTKVYPVINGKPTSTPLIIKVEK